MSRQRVGFIIDGVSVSCYVLDLITEVKSDQVHFESPIIISQKADTPTKSIFHKLLSKVLRAQFGVIFRALLTKAIERVEIGKVKKQPFNERYAENFDISELHLDVLDVTPIISPSGHVHRFNEHDLNRIRAQNIDVLLRCGSGILKGDILQITKIGVLSFHHGDNRINRGWPAGFWEVYRNEPSSGFVIQKLTEELDGGNVILRGNLMTQGFWSSNNAQLLRKSNVFVLNFLRYIAQNEQLPEFESPTPYGNQLYRAPTTYQLVKYILKTYSSFPKERLIATLGLERRWSVSFLPKSGLDAVLFRGITIKNPKNRFLADPFVIEHEGRNVCFVEDFCFDEKKGKISAYELNGDAYREIGVVLEEEFHLSFPYVFQHEESVYMVPESCENRDIRLYKCVNFPNEWELETILMSNVPAADTMVVRHRQRWFMLTNICSADMNDYQSELHVFHSEDLLSPEWIPIPNNPVIFDSRKARNAGYFSIGDRLFRVNQVPGKHHYGKSFEINEIEDMRTTSYSEIERSHIDANFFPGLLSTHHFHMNDKYTVFDHNRLENRN